MVSIFDPILNYKLINYPIYWDFRQIVFIVFIIAFSLIVSYLLSLFIYMIISSIIQSDWFENKDLWIVGLITLVLGIILFNNFNSIPILSMIYIQLHNYIFSLKFLIFHVYTLIITIGFLLSVIIITAFLIVGISIGVSIASKLSS